jgi:hypothetical protein
MAQDDAVSKALSAAKDTLANANKFTSNVTGGADNAFAPKKMDPPKIPAAHAPAHPAHPTNASYSLASEARNTGEGLKARQQNVEDYLATK